ncbi:hypothetical protein QBC34DRAFT_441606 [Podospora aff. communis PSN243]|uniref:Uncharacterized protein n=1 Tax=Podospora aff. communis PSN243 TaxID=3040156 RepID=A0AAV9GDR6_9PEZI|nr:hypothetical protein QBC34DRAFT_441606 [Podospora aff. communis PSN243]
MSSEEHVDGLLVDEGRRTPRRFGNDTLFSCELPSHSPWIIVAGIQQNMSSSEAWIYEYMGDATIPEFKAVSNSVKDWKDKTKASLRNLCS